MSDERDPNTFYPFPGSYDPTADAGGTDGGDGDDFVPSTDGPPEHRTGAGSRMALWGGLIGALLTAVAALFAASGCTTTVVTVSKPDGTLVRAERYRFGREETVDELTIPTPSGTASLKGYKSDSKLAEAAADIAAAAKNATAAAAGVP